MELAAGAGKGAGAGADTGAGVSPRELSSGVTAADEIAVGELTGATLTFDEEVGAVFAGAAVSAEETTSDAELIDCTATFLELELEGVVPPVPDEPRP